MNPKETFFFQQRMKIEESFRDLKNLLDLERLMNKREYMEGVVALVLMAYAIGGLEKSQPMYSPPSKP